MMSQSAERKDAEAVTLVPLHDHPDLGANALVNQF